MVEPIFLEIHNGRRLSELRNYIEGIVKVANIHKPIENTLLDYLAEMKGILNGAKLAE